MFPYLWVPPSWTCTNHLPMEPLPYLRGRSAHRENAFPPLIFAVSFFLFLLPSTRGCGWGCEHRLSIKLRASPSASAYLFNTITSLNSCLIFEQESCDVLQSWAGNPPLFPSKMASDSHVLVYIPAVPQLSSKPRLRCLGSFSCVHRLKHTYTLGKLAWFISTKCNFEH